MKRIETKISAALYTSGYDADERFLRLDTEEEVRVGLSELIEENSDFHAIEALTHAPPTQKSYRPEHDRRVADAESMPLRVFRVHVVAEIEELPQEEAKQWIAKALARNIERQSKKRRR